MFTPQEIQERSDSLEKAVFGGYSVSSVEELRTPLAEDYATLYKENAVLKSRLKSLAEKIEEYRNQEEGISSALLAAQKTADEIVAEAQRKSTRMLNESEQKLRTRNQELMLEVNAEQERVTLAKQAAAKFIVELQDRVQAQLVTLEKLKQMDLTVKSGDAKEEPSRVTTGSVNPLLRRAVAKPQPAPEEKPEDTVREIEENISRILAESGDQSEIDNTKVMKPVK